jgi:hypothetical protein
MMDWAKAAYYESVHGFGFLQIDPADVKYMKFAGLILQGPSLAVCQQTRHLPSKVYISFQSPGLPA